MGYFKNQLIADQVELGDRVLAPKSAVDHSSLLIVRSRRWARFQREERKQRRRSRLLWVAAIVTVIFAGISLGLFAGLLLEVFA